MCVKEIWRSEMKTSKTLKLSEGRCHRKGHFTDELPIFLNGIFNPVKTFGNIHREKFIRSCDILRSGCTIINIIYELNNTYLSMKTIMQIIIHIHSSKMNKTNNTHHNHLNINDGHTGGGGQRTNNFTF